MGILTWIWEEWAETAFIQTGQALIRAGGLMMNLSIAVWKAVARLAEVYLNQNIFTMRFSQSPSGIGGEGASMIGYFISGFLNIATVVGIALAKAPHIAKRLNMNVKLVNVSTQARGMALATSVCDIVFWMEVGDFENWEGANLEDQPENTVVTAPYLSVPLWWAVLKDSPVVNIYREGQEP